jgi:hypothetical protein
MGKLNLIKSNQIMKKPTKVQAPEGCYNNFTHGKIYDVVGFWDELYMHKTGFAMLVIDNNGRIQQCLSKNCPHLNDKDWIIIETES